MDHELRERIDARTIPAEGGCVLWTGGTDAKGYPRIAVGSRMRLVRRLIVEDALGAPFTDPRVVVADRCGNRRCVARVHLVLTTRAAIIAAHPPHVRSSPLAAACGQGHSDWYIAPDGHRQCRVCRRDRARARRAAESRKR